MHMFEITKEFKTIIFLYISFYLQFNPSNHLRGVVVTGSGDKILFDLGDLLTDRHRYLKGNSLKVLA